MSRDQKLPAGYEISYTAGIVQLALPHAVAAELRAREHDKESAECEVLRDERQAKIAAAPAAAAAADHNGAKHPPVPEHPLPGWHRVLPDIESIVQGLGEEAVGVRSPDRDVCQRLAKIGKRLAELGPDRPVGVPSLWNEALDRLEAQMPNFKAPMGLVRNALVLAETTGMPPRIPPLLLLGPPGVGKTLFSQRLAELMCVPHAVIAFDQPSAGSQLRGSDKYWSNTESGLLFELVCLGTVANPVILLDELDKACAGGSLERIDPLAQLHGALEVQTARRIQDISTGVKFDASLVTYVATANDPRRLGLPLLSRFEVFVIEAPRRDEAVYVARLVIEQVLERLRLRGTVRFEPRCAYVLAHLSPRRMTRSVELLVAAALREQRDRVREDDCWEALGCGHEGPRLH